MRNKSLKLIIIILFYFIQIILTQKKECKPPIWGLPDPYQIELQVPKEYEIISSSSSSNNNNNNNNSLQVAIIIAGSIRSFAITEKSWKNYLLENKINKNNIKINLFAHIILSNNCKFSSMGLNQLKSLCTVLEVSSNNNLLIPYNDMIKDIPSYYKDNIEFKEQFQSIKRGNFIDMYYRRYRAFQLSETYRQKHLINWDLMLFLRPDTAFYSPVINLGMFYHTLITYKEQKKHENEIVKPIYIPESCNFYGVCDRIAIGLYDEMKIYFHAHSFTQVLNWSLEEVPKTSSYYCPKKSCLKISEDYLECWFLYNNLTQVFYAKPIPLTFITLRTLYLNDYCYNSRHNYLTMLPSPYLAKTDPDRIMGLKEYSYDYSELDNSTLIEERCGKKFVHMNLSIICNQDITGCDCGDRNRWGIS